MENPTRIRHVANGGETGVNAEITWRNVMEISQMAPWLRSGALRFFAVPRCSERQAFARSKTDARGGHRRKFMGCAVRRRTPKSTTVEIGWRGKFERAALIGITRLT